MPQKTKTEESVVPWMFPPGIQRDGTVRESRACVDGQSVRWFNGHLRKMGGHVACVTQVTNPVRNLDLFWAGAQGYVHAMSQTKLERLTITAAGVTSAVTDRTPAGFTNDTDNNWQSAVMFDEASATNMLIAHCTDNLDDPSSGTARPIYYGDISATAALTTTGQSIDGGIVVLQPYLVAYGSGGDVRWTDANKPADWVSGDAGNDRVTKSKIVRGFPVRAGGDAAEGLLWSLDSLIRMRYVGGTAIFQFQTLSEEISVLSSNAIVEYGGRFFWPATDRFMVYDGTLRDLPNDLNSNWFFDNLNYTHRQKVWGTIIPRFGEIHWHYPRGNATECSHTIIFSLAETVRTGQAVWYDREIARSAGSRPKDFRFPLWAGTDNPSTLWRHEVGTDQVDFAAATTAIDAYAESNPIDLSAQGINDWVLLKRIEPDATQTGDVTWTVRGREFARAADVDTNHTCTSSQTKIDLTEQRRQMRLKVRSNVVGGNFEMGKQLLHIEPGTGQ